MSNSRTARAVPTFVLAMLLSIWLAPAAHAQLGGGLGDAGGDVVDGTSGSLGDATGSVGGTVGGITDGLEGSSGGSGGEGEGSGGGSGGGLIGGVIGGTKDVVEKTVESGKGTLEEVVTDTGDALVNIGSDTVGGIVGTVEEAVVDATRTGKNKKARKSGTAEKTGTTSPVTNGSVVLGKDLADALRVDGQALTTAINDGRNFSVVSADVPADESLVTQIGRIATEAARQAAFPLALTLLVIGFLMVQNRLDRKDPKLALAPVDTEHDLLSFT